MSTCECGRADCQRGDARYDWPDLECYRLRYEREKARAEEAERHAKAVETHAVHQVAKEIRQASEARQVADDWKATAEHLHTAMRRLIASLPNHLVADAERALGTNPEGAAAPGCSEEERK